MQTELLEALRARLRQFGLEQHEALLLPHARLAFDLRLDGKSNGEIGESRWGGAPDVPEGFEWPHAGSPMAFLAQINLADLIADDENPFPARGLLQFFCDYENDACHIALHEASAELYMATAPAKTEDSMFADMTPHHLRLVAHADLPRWATSDYEELAEEMTEDDQDVFGDLAFSSTDTFPATVLAGQLLGHAAGIGQDPREYVLTRERSVEGLSRYEKRAQTDGDAKRWQNLLRFNSVLDLCIGDAGYMVFLVHEDDLKKRDFERVYAVLESS